MPTLEITGIDRRDGYPLTAEQVEALRTVVTVGHAARPAGRTAHRIGGPVWIAP